MNFVINGQPRQFDQLQPGALLNDLIGALGLKGDRIAVELNGNIVSRDQWPAATLRDGDRLEIVHFVGGG